jgi:hypothetical protein
MKSYDQLHLIPSLIAKVVCETPYTGKECNNMCSYSVEKTEKERQKLTPEEINTFVVTADILCRKAYEMKASWFINCVKSGNRGRDQLYVWITHWLASYLTNKEAFIQHHERINTKL